MGFVIRWAAAFVLLALTFNPTRFDYYDWARTMWGEATPLVVLFGLLLIVAYALFLTALFRGIGRLGAVLILAVIAALVWVLVDYRIVSLDNPDAMTWVVLLALSVVLAIGMYWGILWRRMSGQFEVDDEDTA